MARPNNSRLVILGFLVEKPRSGYDIRKAIEASLGNFWNESFGQIYPTLKALEGEGLVEKTQDLQGGRAQRQAYVITQAGRACLDEWLREPAAPQTYRVESLVKLFFGSLIGPAEARAHVARFRAEHQTLVEKYRAIGSTLDEAYSGKPGLPYWKLTVACGVEIGTAYMDWCDRAEAALARLEEGGPHD